MVAQLRSGSPVYDCSVYCRLVHRPCFCAVRKICATVRIAGGPVVLYTRLANAVVLLRRERTDRLAIFNTVAEDHNGITENLNPQAGRLFGYSPEEVIGP